VTRWPRFSLPGAARRESARRAPRGAGGSCTTRQLDTHNIDCREVRYPWHPWHGQQVWIRRSSARTGLPVYQCAADANACRRLLEIPQWMFEASVVCLIRLSATPTPSIEALREVKALMVAGQTADPDPVVKAEHQSLIHRGDPDATSDQVSSSKPTSVVQSADDHAAMGESPARGPAASPRAVSSVAAGRCRRQYADGKPGGGR
jgi:hypothetical protein